MGRHTIPIKDYLEAAQLFHWAVKEHFIMWFTGGTLRHRRTESVLRRLTEAGRLRAVRYGKRLVYTVPRRVKGRNPAMPKETGVYRPGRSEKAVAGLTKIVHGLGCTEGLVRFWRSEMNGEIIPERFFQGLGSVPEWGIRYPNGKMLLYEFCTKDNFLFRNNMIGKVRAYDANLCAIEEKFSAEAIVVFVIDTDRESVQRFVNSKLTVGDPYFFIDYGTFLKAPLGRALFTPVYVWSDGKKYPLKKDV